MVREKSLFIGRHRHINNLKHDIYIQRMNTIDP